MTRVEVLADEQIERMLRQVESVVPESFRHAWSLSAGDVALALREVVAHRAALAAQEGEPGIDFDALAAWEPGDPIPAAQEGEQGGAEVAVAVGTVDLSCELYDAPGQDCITAGPAALAADGCTGCRVRAAVADTAGALAKVKAEAWEDGYLAALDEKHQQDDNPYRADRIEAQP